MHKFDPSHIDRLLRQERQDAIRPEQVLREAGLGEGGVFADVGCGPGFFTLPAAAIVGPSGRVWAIDTQPEMLDALKNRGIPANVTLVRSGEAKIPIEDRAADLALAAYVLHEAADTVAFLMEILRLLRPGGKLVIIDWKKQQEEHGPPEAERITEEEAAAFIASAGFKDVATSSMNASHYMITAVRPQD
ncbi:MAG: methyltransferase domain-containing protein [Deltaproteobacteria bacterium]|nr:methyltransferase domain-containing protein [Deltaproteobacteria bacterium]